MICGMTINGPRTPATSVTLSRNFIQPDRLGRLCLFLCIWIWASPFMSVVYPSFQLLRRGRDLVTNNLYYRHSGGGGIRTRGAKNAHTLSKRAQSTALSPLRCNHNFLFKSGQNRIRPHRNFLTEILRRHISRCSPCFVNSHNAPILKSHSKAKKVALLS